MNAKRTVNRYSVSTEVGIFTRNSERTYTHVVIGFTPNWKTGESTWGVFGWAGRLDLAHATARTWSRRVPGEYRIYSVAGERVL